MVINYKGIVVSLEKDNLFCRRLVAGVDVGGKVMYFFANKDVEIGMEVEISLDEKKIGYESVIVKK